MKGFSGFGNSPVKRSIVERYGAHKLEASEDDKKEKDPSLKDYEKYYAELYGLDKKYTSKGESTKEGLPTDTEKYLKSQGEGYNIWKDKYLKEKITDPVAAKELKTAKETEGLVGDEMATSKEEIKTRKIKTKTKQLLSKESDVGRGFEEVGQRARKSKVGKKVFGVSGKERATTKVEKLKGKEKLARATGQLGVNVNLLSGFQIGPQADKLARRIKRKETRITKNK